MNNIQILQIGVTNYKNNYCVPEYIDWTFVDDLAEGDKRFFDIILVFDCEGKRNVEALRQYMQSYRTFVIKDESISYDSEVMALFSCAMASWLEQEEVQAFLSHEARNYFTQGYGEKFRMKNLCISPRYQGKIEWSGDYCVCLEGEFGKEYGQIAYWRNDIPIFQGQAIDLWLEYDKDDTVSIQLEIVQYAKGTLSDVQNHWVYTEEQMQDIVQIDNDKSAGCFFASVQAKGCGKLKIIALHDRYSRRGHGYFIPGGERHVTSAREELFSYFEPGDRKPPLNVYFSGYKTQQTFEGLYMMRKMGCPFVLLSEPRLEGGSFYMGSDEYEQMVRKVLQGYLDQLEFGSEQMIMSGLSMGTYGAFYYACDFRPHAVLVGKPLASIGNVASNLTTIRPGNFCTAADVLLYLENDLSPKAVERLNRRFWDKFINTEFIDTKFIMSYMIEDDYDTDAYQKFIENLHGSGIRLYGKGIHGRHNDDTTGVVGWFQNQYIEMIRRDFDRE